MFRWLLTRTRSIKQVTGTQFPRVLPIYDLLFTPVIAPHHATLITSSMSLLRPFKATELFKPSNRTFNLNYEVTLDSFLKQPRYPTIRQRLLLQPRLSVAGFMLCTRGSQWAANGLQSIVFAYPISRPMTCSSSSLQSRRKS